tara:strand:- start:1495 stop:2277 length:783 start_codon:yes stop_codon:yes gene_type:complete
MKLLPFLNLVILLFFSNNSFSQEITLEGTNSGNNLYIINPFSNLSSSGFRIDSITVNGKSHAYKPGSAVELKFDSTQFKIGEKLKLIIHHQKDCVPKAIANFNHPDPKNTFVSMNVDSNEILHWSIKNEQGNQIHIVEQFRWNKWIRFGEVKSLGQNTTNWYIVKVSLHHGKNRFRIKSIGSHSTLQYSREIRSISKKPKAEYKLKNKLILFIYETEYRVLDEYARIIKVGMSKKIDIRNLAKGNYLLKYGNKTEWFIVK